MPEVSENVVVTTMAADDLRWAVDWAAREGWNPGLHDARAFWAADPTGFFVAQIGSRVVGTISCVRYGDTFAFAGFYIVDPALRTRGIGHLLGDAAFEHAGDRVLGIDGVVEQQPTYLSLGFTLVHRSIRYVGSASGESDPSAVRLSAADLGEVLAYDEPCFGARRPEFLREWLDQPGSHSVGIRDRSGLAGYGVIRACREGFKVGPLFADDGGIAERILTSLVASVPDGAPVYLDVPEPNRDAVALAARFGMEPVFETARMYRGGQLELPLPRVFGITTFELG